MDDSLLHVYLVDGRILSVPLAWYPRLEYGHSAERSHYELWADGSILAWPRLDEHISLEDLVAGRRSREGSESLARWKKQLDAFRASGVYGEWGMTLS